MNKTATKTRALTLRPHEARRLAETGRVLIVREVDAPTIGPNSGGPIREVVPSLLIGPGLWDVRYESDNPHAIRCPFGPVGSVLWGREAFSLVPCSAGCEKYPEGFDPTRSSASQPNAPHEGVRYHATWTRSNSARRRSSASMPFWASRFPRLVLAACEVKRAGEATRADAVAMGLPDGPWEIVKPGSAPIEYMEIKPADMLAGLAKLPAERWCWFATIERSDG